MYINRTSIAHQSMCVNPSNHNGACFHMDIDCASEFDPQALT